MGNGQSTCGVTTEGRQLLKAVEAGYLPDVEARLNHNLGYVYWSTFSGGNTIWHKAAKCGRLDVLKAMARKVSVAYEAHKGTEEAHQLQVLLKVGASPTEAIKRLVNMFNFKRCTPIMLAAAGGHAEVVAWLLDQGAMLLVHDRIRHQTALHYAVERGHPDCIRLLLTAASHVGTARISQSSRSQLQHHNPTERQLLLSAGNHAGLTALHYAVHEEKYDAIKLLLGYGADINAQAEYPDLDWASVNAGDTPMHVAAATGNIEAIRILLKGFVETSGLLCPECAPPHHARDPRGVRNDYGRLPYHLAMRKQFVWLSELLDPSVPVRYLLTGEEPDTATSLGPPRLSVIAAKDLHKKLMTELGALKEEMKVCSAGGAHGSERLVVETPNSLQVATHAAALAAAAARVPKRRWMLGSLGRQSECDGSGAGGSEAPSSLAGTVNAAGSAVAVAVERVLSRVPSCGGAAAATPFSAADDAASAPGSGGWRSRALSPRTSMSNVPEDSAVLAAMSMAQQQAPQQHQTRANGSRRGSLAVSVEDANRSRPESPLATAYAHITLAPVAGVAKGKGEGGSGGRGPMAVLIPSSEVQPQLGDSSGAGSSSGGAASLVSPGRCESSADSGDKVSPNPELLDEGHGPSVLDGLLRPLRASLSSCQRVAPTGHRCTHCSDDDVTCGVCLDAPPSTCILPCKHVMCVDCALDMCKRYSLGTAACPFCRTLVFGFRAATIEEMRRQ